MHQAAPSLCLRDHPRIKILVCGRPLPVKFFVVAVIACSIVCTFTWGVPDRTGGEAQRTASVSGRRTPFKGRQLNQRNPRGPRRGVAMSFSLRSAPLLVATVRQVRRRGRVDGLDLGHRSIRVSASSSLVTREGTGRPARISKAATCALHLPVSRRDCRQRCSRHKQTGSVIAASHMRGEAGGVKGNGCA